MNNTLSKGIRGSLQSYIVTNIFNIVDFSSKILILDEVTSKIINSCISQNDLGNYNIFSSNIITDNRKQILSCPAIYFLEPTDKNIDLILKDWKNEDSKNKEISEGKYKCAFIFFSKNSGKIIMKLKEIREKIKHICDLPISNFIVPESLIFNLKIQNDFMNFFAKNKNYSQFSLQLMNIFHCLKTIPEIRYFNSEVSTLFANEFNKLLTSINTETQNYTKNSSTLLILDRSYNFVTPFQQIYSYQSLIEYLLGILTINNNTYERIVERDGKKINEKFILDDNDVVWEKIKHKHVLECVTEYNTLKNNLDIKYPHVKKYIDDKKSLSLEQIASAIRELTMYNAEKKLLSAHGDILKKMLDLYEKDFKAIDEFEKKIISKKDKSSFQDIENIIKTRNLSYSSKCRLLILYAITQDNNKIKDIMNLANIDIEINTIIQNIKKGKNHDLKNIIYDIIDDKLSIFDFPSIGKITPNKKKKSIFSGLSTSNSKLELSNNNIIDLISDKKLIIFIIGGLGQYEQSLAQILTQELKQEIIIGSSSIINIDEYIMYLTSLS